MTYIGHVERVWNMRVFIIVLILIFSFQSWTKADDIKEFEIEGMSIGDSLLKFYSETEILNQLSKTHSTIKNNDIKRVYFDISNPDLYSTINIHFKNDKSYKIVSIGGIQYFENDMIGCYSKQEKVIKDIEESFPEANRSNLVKSKHTSDTTGKSSVKDISFTIKNGEIYVSCTDWSDHMTSNYSWTDNLGIYLDSMEYIEWLNNL